MRTTLKAFSFFLVGALATVSLLVPTTVEAQELEPGVVTITVTSTDPGTASVMPAGSTWSISDGENSLSDTFAEGNLALPAEIVTSELPGGEYTVTVNAGPTFGLFSDVYTVNGNTAVSVPLTPVPADPVPPVPETAVVNATTFNCTGLSAPSLLADVGTDCTQISTLLTFYLWSDGTNEHWQVTTNVSGAASVEVPVGNHEVVNEATQERIQVTVPSGGTSFAFGYPVAAPDPDPEMATVNVSTFACENIMGAPVLLNDIGTDCTQISTLLTFYLWSDGTNEHWQVTTNASGAASVEVPVGDHQIVNEATQERIEVTVPSGGATFAIGYPTAAVDPDPEMATVNVSTFACEGVTGDPILLNDIGTDCTQISTLLSFYLWGDGTDDHWQVTTSDSGQVSVNVPVGDHRVINEVTQEIIEVTVPSGGTTLAIGYPASSDVPIETTLIIRIALPNDANIEGAPYSLYAPTAAQFMAEPYLQGVVGANNVIQIEDLIPGTYRVVVEPEGMAAIDFVVEVGYGVTEALATVDANGNVTVTYASQDPPPAADPPAADSPVKGLPETGAGTGISSSVGALGAALGGAILAAGALGVRIRHAYA